jgi:chromosome segregation protein
VGGLEAEIRFVVEGRQRAEQRLLQLKEQAAQWSSRKEEAEAETENLAAQTLEAEEKATLLAAQVEEQGLQLPDLEEALRQAQSKSSEQRGASRRCNSRSRCWPPTSATSRSSRASSSSARAPGGRPQRAGRAGRTAPVQLAAAAGGGPGTAETADARLHELQEQVPQLDEDRRARQQDVNAQSARQADLSRRMEALKALQEKVRTDGKLQPWLAKHGLAGLQGLWTKIHIEQGWENALEAALRERMNALEVSRLDMVRAFASDAPPAKLAFYHAPPRARRRRRRRLPRLADLLRLNDAGQKALLADWLHGCYTAASLEDALAAREQLQAGETDLREVRPCRDGPQRQLLCAGLGAGRPAGAPAGNREPGKAAARAGADRGGGALRPGPRRSRLQRCRPSASRARGAKRPRPQPRARTAGGIAAPDAAGRTDPRPQRADRLRPGEVDALLEELQERRVSAEARFEELDMQLADSQERHAQLDERVIASGAQAGRGARAAPQPGAPGAGSAVRAARAGSAARRTAGGHRNGHAAGHFHRRRGERARAELTRLTDAAAQAGLQSALELKSERERVLGARRSEYDDLTAKLRASDERRLQLERELDPLRQRITELQLKEQAARLGLEQYTQMLVDAQADLEAVGKSVADSNVPPAGACSRRSTASTARSRRWARSTWRRWRN